METTPTIDQAVDYFGAYTVGLYPDVRDRVAHTIIDVRSSDGSTVRFCNFSEEEFMMLKSDNVSTRFDSLFGETLVGVCHAEDGRLYAILKDDDCEFGRRISAVAVGSGYCDGEPNSAVRRARDGDFLL